MAATGASRRLRGPCAALLLVGVCAGLALPASAEYRTVELGSLRITIDSDWGTRMTPGYVPVRFEITNLGEARVIDIVGQSSRTFRVPRSIQSGSLTITRTVRLAPGDRVRLTMPVPVFGDQENIRFEIREDGRTIERFGYSGLQSRMMPRDAAALIVADPTSALGRVAATWPRPLAAGRGVTTSSRTVIAVGPGGAAMPRGAGPPARGAASTLDFLLDPARVPANWVGFTSLRAVVVGPREWAQLSDAQRGALLTWTACGGDLVFVDGDLSALLPGRHHPAAGPAHTAHLFGRIHLMTSAAIEAAGLVSSLAAVESLRDPNWALPANGAPDWGVMAGRGFRLLIPGIDGVPARTYLLILFLFSLLIGPVNYWWLRRKRQQVLVVLTAPFISALFIAVLGGYALVGEGLGVHGRAVTFTMLDQVSRQAATRAAMSLYAAGMTPADGLQFARDSAVFFLGVDGTGSRGRQVLDLTDTQRYAGGVLQARSPTNLEVINFRPARERLSFSQEAGGLGVVNGLDATILALLYRDGEHTYRLAGTLASGSQTLLQRHGPDGRLEPPADLMLPAKLVPVVTNQPTGSYLAVLDRSPFWESGVARLSERGSVHLVMGWPEGQP